MQKHPLKRPDFFSKRRDDGIFSPSVQMQKRPDPEKSLKKAKTRLGVKSENVNWISKDVTRHNFEQHFELWHDRAAFHFLTEDHQITDYRSKLNAFLKSGGYFLLSTFSEKGPDKCSGIPVRKYSTESMQNLFEKDFEIVRLENQDHKTPWEAVQNFTIGLFRKK